MRGLGLPSGEIVAGMDAQLWLGDVAVVCAQFGSLANLT
jgi:hypothetical protein